MWNIPKIKKEVTPKDILIKYAKTLEEETDGKLKGAIMQDYDSSCRVPIFRYSFHINVKVDTNPYIANTFEYKLFEVKQSIEQVDSDEPKSFIYPLRLEVYLYNETKRFFIESETMFEKTLDEIVSSNYIGDLLSYLLRISI